MTTKARVHAGRLVIDEPTNLPEGTEIELLPLDPGDWLDDADRAALHAALAARTRTSQLVASSTPLIFSGNFESVEGASGSLYGDGAQTC